MADTVEALIATIYLCRGEQGEEAAREFVASLGLIKDINFPPVRILLDERPNKPSIASLAKRLEPLEAAIGYKFKSPALLVQALTHTSFTDAITPSYEKLEFVGDALVDFIVTRYLYTTYPDASPRDFTDMRQACTNNGFMSEVARRYGLHKYILHDSVELMHDILEFVSVDWQARDVNPLESDIVPPKVLADVFEALAAALYFELGIEGMWKILFTMMKDLMDKRATPERVSWSPKRRIIEMCQGAHLALKLSPSSKAGTVTVQIFVDKQLIAEHSSTSLHHAEMRASMKVVSSPQFHSLYQAALQRQEAYEAGARVDRAAQSNARRQEHKEVAAARRAERHHMFTSLLEAQQQQQQQQQPGAAAADDDYGPRRPFDSYPSPRQGRPGRSFSHDGGYE